MIFFCTSWTPLPACWGWDRPVVGVCRPTLECRNRGRGGGRTEGTRSDWVCCGLFAPPPPLFIIFLKFGLWRTGTGTIHAAGYTEGKLGGWAWTSGNEGMNGLFMCTKRGGREERRREINVRGRERRDGLTVKCALVLSIAGFGLISLVFRCPQLQRERDMFSVESFSKFFFFLKRQILCSTVRLCKVSQNIHAPFSTAIASSQWWEKTTKISFLIFFSFFNFLKNKGWKCFTK